MLRITETHDSNGPVLKLEGKLLAAWTDELRSACELVAAQSCRPRLDLAAVSYVDTAGAKLLDELRAAGFALAACSPFVTTVLRREGT